MPGTSYAALATSNQRLWVLQTPDGVVGAFRIEGKGFCGCCFETEKEAAGFRNSSPNLKGKYCVRWITAKSLAKLGKVSGLPVALLTWPGHPVDVQTSGQVAA